MSQILKTEDIPLRLTAAAQLVGNGRRLLDVGCGSGKLMAMLENRFAEFYGTDCDSKALEAASARGIKISRLDIDTAGLPHENDFFDAVTATDIIEHIKEPPHLARECARVLKPTGVLIMTTPNIRHVRHVFKLVASGRFPKTSDDSGSYSGGHTQYFTFSDLRGILEQSGFGPIEEYNLFEWVRPTLLRGMKERIKNILGSRLNREFFSSSVVIRAHKQH
ncbi:MAG: class I SAM-dependent methyltransferase [bacterium]